MRLTNAMADLAYSQSKFNAVALFPLPNVVLFPRAIIPLHIFEERYKAMTADLIQGSCQLAMAALRPGWEKDYYGKPQIEPIVCVGTILSHERLADGNYNFLLQGHTRARIIREKVHYPYRVAELEPLREKSVQETDLLDHRQRLMAIFDGGSLLATGIGRQFRQLLCTALPTPDVADLIAFNFFDDVALKQSLLAECDVLARVSRIVDAFEAVRVPVKSVPHPPMRPNLN